MEKIRHGKAGKVYVEVIARFDINGNIRPLSLKWEDGRVYEISKIRDIRPAALVIAGGAGVRYKIIVENQERDLFLEETRWFIPKPE